MVTARLLPKKTSVSPSPFTSANPWKSNTLEWTTPINPGHGNWPGEIPSVYRWPYDYSKPGAPDDFIPQNVPFADTPESNFPHETDSIKIEGLEDNTIIVDDSSKESSNE